MLPELAAEAGVEYEVVTEWDWSHPETANDFSVTAYGFSAAVSLAHKKGLESDSLPNQKRKAGAITPNPSPTPAYVPATPVASKDAAMNALVAFANSFKPAENITTSDGKKCGIGMGN